MAAGGEDEEESSFRWIDAARYAVASVVIILMVVVVVKAKMVLRPKSLYLSVPGGSVEARPQREAAVLALDLSIRAQNPSRRVSLCFVNVTGYIFDNSVISAGSSSDPEFDSMVYFAASNDMFLPPNSEQLRLTRISVERGQSMEAPYFDMLYEGRNIIDVTLRLDGWLSTRLTSDCNTTARDPGRRTTFYCRPLLIVVGNLDVVASMNKQEAFCVSGGKSRGAN